MTELNSDQTHVNKKGGSTPEGENNPNTPVSCEETTNVVRPKRGNTRFRAYGPNTWNNYSDSDYKLLYTWCKVETIQFAINKEIGKCGTPHLQFCCRFANQRSFDKLKEQFPKVHWEIAKDWNKVFAYCQKKDTQVEPGVVGHRLLRPPPNDPLEGLELRPFQKFVLKLLEENPDSRTIYWIYDEYGNTGKTYLAKSLSINHPGSTTMVTGKANDCKYGIVKFLENEYNDLKVVFFDFPRSLEHFVSYQAIEEIKNGYFFSGKYESNCLIFNCPHVIVFANFLPNETQLSSDRWCVYEINESFEMCPV